MLFDRGAFSISKEEPVKHDIRVKNNDRARIEAWIHHAVKGGEVTNKSSRYRAPGCSSPEYCGTCGIRIQWKAFRQTLLRFLLGGPSDAFDASCSGA